MKNVPEKSVLKRFILIASTNINIPQCYNAMHTV